MYRKIRTTQERRVNGCRPKWARAKRSLSNLPNSWDDIYVHFDKCWKSKRKTQYRCGHRGKENNLYIDERELNSRSFSWNLKEYFEEHDIPYRIKPDYQKHIRRELITSRREIIRYEKVVYYRIEYKEYYYYKPVYIDVPIKPYYQTYSLNTFRGWYVTWWSDKDIGVEYILRSAGA